MKNLKEKTGYIFESKWMVGLGDIYHNIRELKRYMNNCIRKVGYYGCPTCGTKYLDSIYTDEEYDADESALFCCKMKD